MAEAPPEVAIHDDIRVFVFVNKAGETVATTRDALAKVGDFAFLNVVAASEAGAFLDREQIRTQGYSPIA